MVGRRMHAGDRAHGPTCAAFRVVRAANAPMGGYAAWVQALVTRAGGGKPWGRGNTMIRWHPWYGRARGGRPMRVVVAAYGDLRRHLLDGAPERAMTIPSNATLGDLLAALGAGP